MQSRLTELKQEYQQGEAQLRILVQQEAALRETLLRISGAIQLLEELLSHDQVEGDRAEGDGGPPDPAGRLDGARAQAPATDAATVHTAP
ncbi:hypothetical protein ACFV0O_38865 [Kitasatospora sp. NPDC059577]|uniref:hypothetical protein n=1 Tax=Kitasatospora sp. NPDC059577 TaxID=3346873 RepID=UPI00368BC4B4